MKPEAFLTSVLALWKVKVKVKDPRYMQNKKDSIMSLIPYNFFCGNLEILAIVAPKTRTCLSLESVTLLKCGVWLTSISLIRSRCWTNWVICWKLNWPSFANKKSVSLLSKCSLYIALFVACLCGRMCHKLGEFIFNIQK